MLLFSSSFIRNTNPCHPPVALPFALDGEPCEPDAYWYLARRAPKNCFATVTPSSYVWYRYDAESRLHFPKVEPIIEQAFWSLSLPRMTGTTLMGVLGE